MRTVRSLIAAFASTVIAACGAPQEGAGGPAEAASAGPAIIDDDATDAETFSAIGPAEMVRFTGTEPFWGGQVSGTALTYSTPDDPDGAEIAVTRFAGRGGVSWSGTHQGGRLVLAVTPGECSDGMSDRTYPFVATLEVGGEQRSGCAWTDRQPFTGPANP